MLNEYLGLVPFIIIAYLVVRYWETVTNLFKKLTVSQIIKVILLYIAAIALATSFIYYGGNWVSTFMPSGTPSLLGRIGVIIATFFILFPVLQSLIHKATNGIISNDP